jgi:nucleoid-associated protein YgaU
MKSITLLVFMLFSIPVMAKTIPNNISNQDVSVVSVIVFSKVIQTPAYLADYTVKKGDTLSSIANGFYGVNSMNFVKKIAIKNHIKNVNKIYVNEKLLIPLNGYGPFL